MLPLTSRLNCGFALLSALAFPWTSLHAGTPDAAASSGPVPDSTRYGLFNGLDHRSQYGAGVFPEPFLVDDSDLEVNELRFDWMYSTRPGDETNHFLRAEIEKGFGNLTVELEVPFEIDKSPGQISRGFDNIDVGARYPLFQSVSSSGFVDNTIGVAVEVGIPVHTAFSQNTELVPKMFDDLKVGNFTVQAVLGYSMLYGPGDDGGLNTFEYGFVFGYSIKKPWKGVEALIPVFELSGERELNHDDAGHNSLTANVGLRFNLEAIGKFQPRLGIGYVFPMDRGAREELRSGIFTSLVFEY